MQMTMNTAPTSHHPAPPSPHHRPHLLVRAAPPNGRRSYRSGRSGGREGYTLGSSGPREGASGRRGRRGARFADEHPLLVEGEVAMRTQGDLQLPSGAMEPDLDRVEGGPEHPGDLRVAQLLQVMQEDDLLVLGGEGLDVAPDAGAHVGLLKDPIEPQLVRDVAPGARCPRLAVDEGLGPRLARRLAEPVVADMRGDPVQPRDQEVGIAERVQLA